MGKRLPTTAKPVMISAIAHKRLADKAHAEGMKIGRLADRLILAALEPKWQGKPYHA